MPFASSTKQNYPCMSSSTSAASSIPATSGKVSSLQRAWSNAPNSRVPSSRPSQPPTTQPSATQPPAWQANDAEWPASPPRKKIKSTSGVVAAGGGGWRANGGTRDSGVGLASGVLAPQRSSFTAASRKPFAIPFKAAVPLMSASTSGSGAAGPNSAPAKKVSNKRTFPWDTGKVGTSASAVGGAKVSINKNMLTGSARAAVAKESGVNLGPKQVVGGLFLSHEQRAILDLVKSGDSVFFTGSAGTGKSVLLRHIIKELKAVTYRHRPDAVYVTASTGMAACNIEGTTIHSFAGIGLGNEKKEQLVVKVKKNRKAAGRWQRAKVLIIDEISMVDGDLFDKLEHIARKLKKSEHPFGGIQVIVTGDFFQLPPVSRGQVKFAFDADSWGSTITHTINLTQVFRQKDTTFVDMLNEMRMSKLSPSSIERFLSLRREPRYTDGIDPTELYPVRSEVERSNTARLGALPGPAVEYVAVDSGKGTDEQKKRDFANMMAVDKLVLKKDAQVMMIKNVAGEDGAASFLVNGLVGKVVDFVEEHLTISQWKEEGVYTAADEPVAMEWEEGDVKPMKGRSKSKVGGPEKLPVVRWYLPNGTQEHTLVTREEFKVENAEGEVMSKRAQLPLILAWAMSIHKSQGQTLNRVKVDLGRVFEKGQSYVALSRATSLEGLQVLRFDPKKVMAHPAVVKWSNENLKSI